LSSLPKLRSWQQQQGKGLDSSPASHALLAYC